MIKIQIPNNNIPERQYIIEVLMTDFLGLPYQLETSDEQSDYVFTFDTSTIIVKDSFFSGYPKVHSYLKMEAIPQEIVFAQNQFTIEKDIPVLFGTDEIEIADKKISCGIDIFASSYFMLTRWEEFVHNKTDEHQRFIGTGSVAFKHGLLSRPLVNEYVEMFWNLLVKCGYKGQRKQRKFELTLTHDIDAIALVSFRSLLGDIVKRRNISLACKNVKFLFAKDPFDTYDFLMDISEQLGLKSHFYFMATDSGMPYDTSWYVKHPKFFSVVESIKRRGHIIGFHPGYYTFNNPERWQYEKNILEKSIQQRVTEGRQHFLRMEIPLTMTIWEDNNMLIDSSLGYSEHEGFRCGTGDCFTVFDFVERKKLKLKERPLVIMDGTLKQSQNYSNEKAAQIIHSYIAVGKKYKTGITLLFHNSSFFGQWSGYKAVYSELLKHKLT